MSRLVVLEGLDGAGTTTQARLAADRLLAQGRSAHLTREPSDGPIGRLIREFLAGGHAVPGQVIHPETFALLFAADRSDHAQREVAPQLDAGDVVVSDRWYHSSFAYQASSDRELSWVARLNERVRRPDLTIFLRVDPEVCAHRRVAAGRARELFDDIQIQRRVAARYEAAIDFVWSRGERVEIVDGERPIESVGAGVAELIDDLLGPGREATP